MLTLGSPLRRPVIYLTKILRKYPHLQDLTGFLLFAKITFSSQPPKRYTLQFRMTLRRHYIYHLCSYLSNCGPRFILGHCLGKNIVLNHILFQPQNVVNPLILSHTTYPYSPRNKSFFLG